MTENRQPYYWHFMGILFVLVACDGGERTSGSSRLAEQALFAQEVPPPCTVAAIDKREAPVDTVILRDSRYPCRLYFRETGVVLRGDLTGRQPYPGRHVVRDGRGRYITSVAGENGRLAIWNEDGSFREMLGRAGLGPGEIPPSGFSPIPFVDAENGLYVRSGSNAWTVFDAEHQFVARQFVPSSGRMETNAVFPPGRILISSPPGLSRASSYFQLLNVSGVVEARMSEVPARSRASTFARMIFRGEDSTFWAGPDVMGGEHEYVLERWSLSGKLLTRVERAVEWFPGAVHIAPPTISPAGIDRDGNLLVYSWIRSGAAPDTSNPGAEIDVHIEVIDWRNGRVLASEVVNGRSIVERTIPRYFFPRTNLGYRYDDAEDEPVVRIIEYGLTSH